MFVLNDQVLGEKYMFRSLTLYLYSLLSSLGC